MSRIGKMPVAVPAGVDVSIKQDQISVKGTGGSLSLAQNAPVSRQLLMFGHAHASAPRAIPILLPDLPRAALVSPYNAPMQNQPKTIPTEQEITDACTAIRLNWTDEEFRRRTNSSSEGPNLSRSSDVYWHQSKLTLTADGAPA